MKKTVCIILVGLFLILTACANDKQEQIEIIDTTNVGPSTTIELAETEIFDISETETEPEETMSEDAPFEAPSEHVINGISFVVPSDWLLMDSDGTSISFYNESNGNNGVMQITCETIAPIMKLDTGGDSSICSKEDVVKQYGAEVFVNIGIASITDEKWMEQGGLEYCNQNFTMNAKTRNSTADYSIGRYIIIPINDTDAYFSVRILCDPNNRLLSDGDFVLNSAIESIKESSHTTEREKNDGVFPFTVTDYLNTLKQSDEELNTEFLIMMQIGDDGTPSITIKDKNNNNLAGIVFGYNSRTVNDENATDIDVVFASLVSIEDNNVLALIPIIWACDQSLSKDDAIDVAIGLLSEVQNSIKNGAVGTGHFDKNGIEYSLVYTKDGVILSIMPEGSKSKATD